MLAPEWRPIELWKLGLEVAAMPGNEPTAPLRYLQRISRTRTVLVGILLIQRPYIVPHLVRELIAANCYEEALETVNEYVIS